MFDIRMSNIKKFDIHIILTFVIPISNIKHFNVRHSFHFDIRDLNVQYQTVLSSDHLTLNIWMMNVKHLTSILTSIQI